MTNYRFPYKSDETGRITKSKKKIAVPPFRYLSSVAIYAIERIFPTEATEHLTYDRNIGTR